MGNLVRIGKFRQQNTNHNSEVAGRGRGEFSQFSFLSIRVSLKMSAI